MLDLAANQLKWQLSYLA